MKAVLTSTLEEERMFSSTHLPYAKLIMLLCSHNTPFGLPVLPVNAIVNGHANMIVIVIVTVNVTVTVAVTVEVSTIVNATVTVTVNCEL